MIWTEIKNLQSVSLKEIPNLEFHKLREQIVEMISKGCRLIQFFGEKINSGVILYVVLADDEQSKLFIASSNFNDGDSFDSITPEFKSFHLFEREFYEQFGIKPQGHPWLKPVRKGIAGISKEEIPYEFFKMIGEEVHEVGVGPIHAGIIEPGHFRFSCHGEQIHHLEIELGFQHRGIEELFIRNKNNPVYLLKLSESIAGDTVVGHAGTFARAIESLSENNISRRAMVIRTIALELERIGIHLGDLSALSGDVAYLTGNAAFGALRTKVINTTLAICGSRFGHGMIAVGGVNYDISSELKEKILDTINKLEEDVEIAAEVLFSSASVLARFEKTGIITNEIAKEIGMVGPAARASGVAIDIRSDHPFGGFSLFPVHKLTLKSGDVFARAYIRYIEITQSIKIIKEQLETFSEGELKKTSSELKPNHFVISLAEGWRGEISHTAITDENGRLRKYKIKDPSFNNWLAVALSVKNNGVSDFPLCNKSFNLSYSGFDL
ncbi:MAG: NADH-quinone oxidoreductase subunit C [Bacteroidetes bacterium]|nr:NADH-quinone oxidoreductase subunit C [Bacteroidota bacterium]